MIPYSNITLNDVIDEVFLRLGQTRTGINIDWSSTRRMVNRSIKEVVSITSPYKSWAYLDRIVVSNGSALSVNLIVPIRLLVSETGSPPYMEARKIDVREQYTVTDSNRSHSWNRDLNFSPVYYLWGDTSLTPTNFVIYIFPSNFQGILEASVVPPDLVAGTSIIPVPYEFVELVILGTLARVYHRFKIEDMVITTFRKIAEKRDEILGKYIEERKVEELEQEVVAPAPSPLFIRQPQNNLPMGFPG